MLDSKKDLLRVLRGGSVSQPKKKIMEEYEYSSSTFDKRMPELVEEGYVIKSQNKKTTKDGMITINVYRITLKGDRFMRE